MKRIVEQAEKDALAAIHSEPAQALLRHVLSPIEKAALRRGFQPFRYNLNGVKVYINGYNSRRLLYRIKDKLDQLNFIVNKERNSANIPLHLREVFDDPSEILGLPTHVRNRLCTIECYSMYAVIKLGRDFFKNWPGFDKRSLAALDALFAKHNSENLFK
ncbi:MAG: hypothetical protein ACXVP0_00480 [Bacteroidia bacterium]